MVYISLDEAKDALSIERENTAHDARLTRLVAAATSWAKTFLNRDLETLDANSPPDSPFTLPEDLRNALFLHVEAYFEKDPANMTLLLQAAEKLAWPYRVDIGP